MNLTTLSILNKLFHFIQIIKKKKCGFPFLAPLTPETHLAATGVALFLGKR